MANDTRNQPWSFPGKRNEVKNLGKTVLQIEHEQLARNRQMIVPPSDVNNSDYQQSPLSADECAIAVNDPNGCASWLRGLADAIERGEHVGTMNVRVKVYSTQGYCTDFEANDKFNG